MMTLDDLPIDIRDKFECFEWKHSVAILKNDFPDEWKDIIDMLREFAIPVDWIEERGGRKSKIAEWIDNFLIKNRGWEEKNFMTSITVDKNTYETPTHKIDCYKNHIGLELEWNNKDPFFDRDLNNFRLLYNLQTISVGIIITRCDDLQEVFNELGKGASYGASTTHMSKLIPRIKGGGGAGCPLLVFGITKHCIQFGD